MKFICFLLPLFFCLNTEAAHWRSMAMDAKIELDRQGQKLALENRIIISPEQKGWYRVAKSKSGVLILGKTNEKKDGAINFSFLLLDWNRIDPVISNSHIIVKLGQEASMSVSNNSDTINLAIKVSEQDH